MARTAKSNALSVWMNGERVGLWSFRTRGSQEFEYDSAWLDSAVRRPLSLSMPLRPPGEPYRGERVEAFFDNLLPDNRRIRERLQRRFQTQSTDAFDLLSEIGRDCVGAVQLLPPEKEPPNVRRITGDRLSTTAIERLLSAMLDPALGQTAAEDDEAFRISIAGAQEKTAFLLHENRWHLPRGTTPTTHIFKLPIGVANQGIDLTTSVENEWLCAQIVREFGLRVANCQMQQFGRFKVLVVERFDRRLADDGRWWIRLPQEDMCQATGTPSARKYEADGGPGIRQIADLLLGSSRSQADRSDFMRAQLVFWLLCAIDGHAKNFSVAIEPEGNFRLTPLYDVLTAHPVLGNRAAQLSPRKVKMAMAVEGSSRHYRWNDMQPRHWIETGKRCGMQAEVERLIGDVASRVPTVVATVGKLIPKGFPAEVADRTLEGLEASAKRLGVH
jgi:serine/threonine-protein kinase HipA